MVITGDQVQARLKQQLQSRTGDRLASIVCPNRGLHDGESIDCNATFQSGRSVVITVGVSGDTASPRLRVGISSSTGQPTSATTQPSERPVGEMPSTDLPLSSSPQLVAAELEVAFVPNDLALDRATGDAAAVSTIQCSPEQQEGYFACIAYLLDSRTLSARYRVANDGTVYFEEANHGSSPSAVGASNTPTSTTSGTSGGGSAHGVASTAGTKTCTSSNGAPASVSATGGGGTVTASGQIGSLKIGVSCPAAVEAFAGMPQDIATANFHVPVHGSQSRTVRFFGYDCHPMPGSYTGGVACQTFYYFASALGGPLEAFATSSASFHTSAGTAPGMTVAEAQSRQDQQATPGCHAGFANFPGPDSLIVLTGGQPTLVNTIWLESKTVPVGLEGC